MQAYTTVHSIYEYAIEEVNAAIFYGLSVYGLREKDCANKLNASIHCAASRLSYMYLALAVINELNSPEEFSPLRR